MAFEIKCKSVEEAQRVVEVIRSYMDRSRFVLGHNGYIEVRPKRRPVVAITGIRLRTIKGYCGNHAGPCKVTGGKHKRLAFLEGLDWVAFNDMLNDALDSIEFNGDVASTACVIRRGRCRRLEYDSSSGHGDFDREGDYADCIGMGPQESDYVSGTPGIRGWGVECVEEIA